MTEAQGKVRFDPSVIAEVVALGTIDVNPKADINPAGGTILTVTGAGLPTAPNPSYNLKVVLDAVVECEIISVTQSGIQCKSGPFPGAARMRMLSAASFDASVTYDSDDGAVGADVAGLGTDPAPLKATGISPSTMSPIAVGTIVVQLDAAAYPATGMAKEDFTVFIEPKELEPTQLVINNGGKRQLNVVAVDASLKTITLKYGGAYSGTYRLSIKSEANGSIDTHPLELLVVFQITGFSPKTGSVYGGTKLTITGGPFIPGDLTQTPIKVGPEL